MNVKKYVVIFKVCHVCFNVNNMHFLNQQHLLFKVILLTIV